MGDEDMHLNLSWMKRVFEWRLLVPVALGILFGLGDGVSNADGRFSADGKSMYLRMAFFIVLFIMVFLVARFWLERRGNLLQTTEERPGLLDYRWSVRSLMVLWTIIVICWIPYIVTLFPGVYWSDTSKQLLEYYGYEPFTDHHPFALTYLFGWFADLGTAVFGNAIYGLYILIVIQLIAAPALFALMVLYSRRLGVSRAACHAELAFFALFPVFPVMFASLAKDTISVLFLIPFCIVLAEIVRTKGAVCAHRWVVPVLLLTALLACITKKPCVYVIVPSLVFVCALRFSNKVRATLIGLAAVIAVIMLGIIPKAVLPALRIEPGSAQETIPFAIQQVAHDVKYDGDDMSDEDRQLVGDFLTIPYDSIPDAYDPVIADPVKGTSLKNPDLMGDFLRLWLRKTVEHPVGHLESWMGLVSGWFSFRNNDGSPNYMVVCTESAWYYDPITEVIPQWPTEASHSKIARSLYDTEQSIPVLNGLFSRSIWASVIPFFMLYMVLRPGKGKFRRLVMMMPVNMTFAYLLLTPVSGMGGEPTRYLLQLICIIPLFFSLIVTREREDGPDIGVMNGAGALARHGA